MKRILFILLLLSTGVAHALTRTWTNSAGGDWSGALNWSPNSPPGAGDTAFITNAGTYTVTITASGGVAVANLTLGGPSGTQTLIQGSATSLSITNTGTVLSGAILSVTNAGVTGNLSVLSGGQLQLAGTAFKVLYSLTLVNQGTVTWSGGTLEFGNTFVTNSGLWLMSSDDTITLGGGSSIFVNSGILRKVAGTGNSYISSVQFLNQPTGLVDGLSGTIYLNTGPGSVLAGTLNATIPGMIDLAGGPWTEAGATITGTGTNQFTSGSLNLVTNSLPGLKLTGGNIYITGTTTFQQGGAITNLTLDGATLAATNRIGTGQLTFNSGSLAGQITISSAGQLNLASSGSKLLYSLTLNNQGIVQWSGGILEFGSTIVSNGGTWLMTGDNSLSWGGYNPPVFTNAGILRKSGTSGSSTLSPLDFVNLPGALVDGLTGTLVLGSDTNSILGGTLNASAPGVISLYGGVWTDAGAVATGTGACQFNSGTFNLRTNVIPGLPFLGGTVYVTGTNTFQQAGAITNLVLNGAALAGTNVIGAGSLTINNGSVLGQLTVLPGGSFNTASNLTKTFYNLTLINRGTFNWNGGGLYCGSTIISNGGLWLMATDDSLSWGGYNLPLFTNAGTMRKSGTSGSSSISAMFLTNLPSGVVEADSGTILLPSALTNSTGTLLLKGGAINGGTGFALTGGTLTGAGSINSIALNGGTVVPGQNGPGAITFTSGLNFNSGATLILDGTGTAPGSQYDQLIVSGAVSLGNANLVIASLPAVQVGTAFYIITNLGVNPVSGTFNGLPENSVIQASGQPFRIHYAAGNGSAVSLVRDVGLDITNAGISGTNFSLAGVGGSNTTYKIQATTNFINWVNLGTATGDSGGHISFTDSNASLFPYRFYRTTN